MIYMPRNMQKICLLAEIQNFWKTYVMGDQATNDQVQVDVKESLIKFILWRPKHVFYTGWLNTMLKIPMRAILIGVSGDFMGRRVN